MTRKNTNEELWVAVSEVGVLRDGGAGTGTLAVAAANGDGTLTLGTGEGSDYAANDYIRVGSGNLTEVWAVESVATDVVTIRGEIVFPHAIGDAHNEQVKVNLGDISEDGVTRETTSDRQEFRVATQAGIYATLLVSSGLRLSWNLVNHSLENVLASLGIPESVLGGTGTTADPFTAPVDPDTFDTVTDESLYFAGSLEDGTTVEIRGCNAQYDANQTMTYARGNPALLPMLCDVSLLVYLSPAA